MYEKKKQLNKIACKTSFELNETSRIPNANNLFVKTVSRKQERLATISPNVFPLSQMTTQLYNTYKRSGIKSKSFAVQTLRRCLFIRED